MKTKQVNIGNTMLYCGDCFKVLPTLDIQADAIVSDPPFGTTNCDWDIPIPLDTFWDMVEGQTKPTANFVLFGCGKFTNDLINSNPQWYRYDLIWTKSKKCGFLNANLQPMRNHESILIFTRPGFFKAATYNPQKTPGGRVGVRQTKRRGGVYRSVDGGEKYYDGMQHPCSVLSFKSEFGLHPTQKPLELMEWLIRTYTNECDTIIDPFMGSGTTAVACVRTDRKFIGIERNKNFFDIACERVKKAYCGEV
jgi:site-specific DNA-methyltransferase (adenine-specific)